MELAHVFVANIAVMIAVISLEVLLYLFFLPEALIVSLLPIPMSVAEIIFGPASIMIAIPFVEPIMVCKCRRLTEHGSKANQQAYG